MKSVVHELPLRIVFGAKDWAYWRRIAHVLELCVSKYLLLIFELRAKFKLPAIFLLLLEQAETAWVFVHYPKSRKKKNGGLFTKLSICYCRSSLNDLLLLFMIKFEITKAAGERLIKLSINKTRFSLTFVLIFRKNLMYRKWIHVRLPTIRLGMVVNIQDGLRWGYYLLT